MSIIGLIVTGAVADSRLSPGNPARCNCLSYPMLNAILNSRFRSSRLTNAMDYSGRTCGVTDSVKSRPNGYYLASGAGGMST